MKTFIIGGGNSITNETYELLNAYEDKFVFCVNTTFKFIEPDAVVWLDRDLYFKNKEWLDAFTGLKFAQETPNYDRTIEIIKPVDVFPSEFPCVYAGKKSRGWVSGVCAISIALALGHYDIYLLGFDGGEINGKLHHHEDSRDKDVFSITVDQYEPFRGKPITNLSPDSQITVFKKDILC